MDEVTLIVYKRKVFEVDRTLEFINREIEKIHHKTRKSDKNLIKYKTEQILQQARDKQ